MPYVLTIPDQKEAAEAASKAPFNGCDQLLDLVRKSPLAKSERGRPRGMDNIYLSRYSGTDLCQWYGRCADGYHRPIGRIMRIVRVAA